MKKRKPLHVETLNDLVLGRTIDIVMDWETKKFVADPKDGRAPFEHAECAVVRAKAKELLKTSFVFEWRSVIIIDVDGSVHSFHGDNRSDTYATASLRFKRCELALKADGKTAVARPHMLDVTMGWQVDRREQGRDVETFHDSPDVELPYTQEAWDGLVALARVINHAHEVLTELVKTPPEKLARRLAMKSGALLLSAAVPPAPPARKGKKS